MYDNVTHTNCSGGCFYNISTPSRYADALLKSVLVLLEVSVDHKISYMADELEFANVDVKDVLTC